MATAAPKQVDIKLDLSLTTDQFGTVITFNWFHVEPTDDGCIIYLAWVDRGVEIVHSLILSMEGLRQIRASAETYLKDFGAAPEELGQFPKAQIATPKFTNFAGLARNGGWAEMAFYLIPLSTIASIARSDKKEGAIKPLGVALAHSTGALHEQLVLSMFALLKDDAGKT